MKAVRLQQPRGAVCVDQVEARAPGPGEVLARMEACGVCHSDLFVGTVERLAAVPLTLGHEAIGRIEALGPGVDGWAKGDRVGITFLAATCGACELCRSRRERYCARQSNFGYSVNGAMAEFVTAPATALVRVPDDADAAALAPMCCAGWTAFGALREAAVPAGGSVALFGFGGLGHLALQIARSQGLRAAVADASEAKLEAARAAGAEMAVAAEGAGRTLTKEWGGVDAAIVLTGSAAAIPQAFKSVKRLGTVVLVGLSLSQYELPLVDTVLKGISIRGSYLGSREDLAAVLRMAQRGEARAEVERHSIDDAPVILERMKRGEIAGRAVIVF